MFKKLTSDEKKLLEKYVRSIASETAANKIILQPEHITTWAFLRWTP
jgi:hypothetical protein